MAPQYSQRQLEAVDLHGLVVPGRAQLGRARILCMQCEIVENSPDKISRENAILKLNTRETLEQFCRIQGGKERLLKSLEIACSDPYWRVRNYASSALRLMTDLGLLEPARMLAMIEAGTFFAAPRHTVFSSLDQDVRFVEDGIPLNRDWTARANVRAAGLWAWAEVTPSLTSPSNGAFGFRKIYPPGSSGSLPLEEIGHRDPFGIAGKHALPGLMRQYLAFSMNNRCEYTRKRQYVENGIAMLVLGAPNCDRPLDSGQIDELLTALAPKRAG